MRTRQTPNNRLRTLAARLGCVARGHQWQNQPNSNGTVIVLCERCDALIVTPYVDAPVFLVRNLPEVGKDGPLGDLAAGRAVVALMRARRRGDRAATARARRELTARPGAAVDAFAEYAETLVASLTRDVYVADMPERLDLTLATLHDLAALDQNLFPKLGGGGEP